MMNTETLNLVMLFSSSLSVSVLGALASILLRRFSNGARIAGGIFGIIAAGLGVCSSILMVFGTPIGVVNFDAPFLLTSFSLQFNPLAGLLIGVLSILALASWIYSLAYVKEYGHKAGTIGFFMNLFIPAMSLVITCDNAFWFIVFFEIMSLTSYFLVIIDQDSKAVKAGLLYLIMSHCGLVLVMIAFFLMASQSGSLSFASFRSLDLSPFLASAVFLLTFVGFGFKAGLVPFHSWLPLAHPSAPSHVSALMSGGMIKIGIFGIVKVTFDLLATSGSEVWWGLVVLFVGALSSVLGVAWALAEHDLKRLLAYHSCENVGIIALGIGAGIIGWALEMPLLTVMGLMAGLYHLINHALFKALLFLGAGAVLFRTHTRNMEHMGGLSRVMPVTAFCFLIGSLAISAIPPLNGFVSEWFTYQSLFNAALEGGSIIALVAVLAAVALALTGALAVTCFVKAYGITFSGSPRSKAAAEAHEVPVSMVISMVALAALCVFFGLGSPLVAPALQGVAAAAAGGTALPAGATVATGVMLEGAASGAMVSTPIIALLLIGAVLVVLLVKRLFSRAGKESRKAPWACGYQSSSQMPVLASSFAENVTRVFSPLYAVRTNVGAFFSSAVGLLDHRGDEPLHSVDGHPAQRAVVDSLVRLVNFIGEKVRFIEGGNYRVYCVYIMVALMALLLLNVVFD